MAMQHTHIVYVSVYVCVSDATGCRQASLSFREELKPQAHQIVVVVVVAVAIVVNLVVAAAVAVVSCC